MIVNRDRHNRDAGFAARARPGGCRCPAEAAVVAPDAELPFAWYTAGQLDAVDMFADTRARAAYLLDRIDVLAELRVAR
ncbi:MAG: hypothetical protein ACRDRA_17125 [Pseudonocardiaceae bacterium]